MMILQKYCARNVTIKDEIEKLNLKPLDTTGEDTVFWNKKISGKESLKSHFSNLSIDFQNPDMQKIRTGCESVKNKNKKESKYEDFLNSYKFLCTKPKER